MENWYPGHMARGERVFKENIKLIDLIIETLDARIPASSRNDILNDSLTNKEHVIILNKYDLADKVVTKNWLSYFRNKYSVQVVATNALQKNSINKLKEVINTYSEKINRKMKDKGRKARSIRIMVVGIPNVGKSAIINSLAGSNIARTGNKPGITRGKQWIKIGREIELLDTPGILNPQMDNEEQIYKLAIAGAINNKHYDPELIAYEFIKHVCHTNKHILEEYFNIFINQEQPYDILAKIGKTRGCLMSGGKVDRERAAKIILNDYQKGKMGALSLERPPAEGE